MKDKEEMKNKNNERNTKKKKLAPYLDSWENLTNKKTRLDCVLSTEDQTRFRFRLIFSLDLYTYTLNIPSSAAASATATIYHHV